MFAATDTIDFRKNRLRCRKCGFTLAELSIVVLIISILAAVSVPRYMSALMRYQADAAARRVKSDLEYLRRMAQKSSASRSVVFNLTNHTYAMANVQDLNRKGSPNYLVNLKLTPYNARLNSANCGGDTTLVFNGYGKPDTSATIVVTSGSISKTVTVESTTGSVSIQ